MGTALSHTSSRLQMLEDSTVKAELNTWSSEKFHHECALIYTSRSNPTHTCISYYRVNHNKALFTLHDSLCEGNTVRIDMEYVSERMLNGLLYVVTDGKAEGSSGRFMERIDQPGFDLFRYQDKFQRRIGQLEFHWERREVNVQFRTGIDGDSFLTYFLRILCHPLKGFDVYLCGPHCEGADYFGRPRPIGLCKVEYVSGMPPHDVLKCDHVKQSDSKAEKQDNNVVAPSLASTQTNVVANTGQNQGNFNSSYFKDCHITFDAQAMQFKGFNNT